MKGLKKWRIGAALAAAAAAAAALGLIPHEAAALLADLLRVVGV